MLAGPWEVALALVAAAAKHALALTSAETPAQLLSCDGHYAFSIRNVSTVSADYIGRRSWKSNAGVNSVVSRPSSKYMVSEQAKQQVEGHSVEVRCQQ